MWGRRRAQVLPLDASLPRQVCHNDLNDHNLVVTAVGDGIAGVIDFGGAAPSLQWRLSGLAPYVLPPSDRVHTWRVNELAICIAYGAAVC